MTSRRDFLRGALSGVAGAAIPKTETTVGLAATCREHRGRPAVARMRCVRTSTGAPPSSMEFYACRECRDELTGRSYNGVTLPLYEVLS